MKNNQTFFSWAGLLVLFGLAGFAVTLQLIPSTFDEIVLFSTAERYRTPFPYFIGDWGMGNFGYRPLLSASFWILYQLFGISSVIHQATSVFFHLLVAVVLFRILHRQWNDAPLAFLISSLTLFSLYTVIPATWTTDRSSLYVGLCLLLLIDHLDLQERANKPPNLMVVMTLSVLALMSKESGLVVVGLVVASQLRWKPPFVASFRLAGAGVALTIAYMAARAVMFGGDAVAYKSNGYLFGLKYYESAADLSGSLIYLSYVDNIIKTAVAPFLPLFESIGGLVITPGRLVLILTSLGLFILAFSKKPSRLQVWAFWITLMNGVIHVSTWRYRTVYLSMLAFSLFLGSSTQLKDNPGRRKGVMILAAIQLLYCFYWVGGHINDVLLGRHELLMASNLKHVSHKIPEKVDPKVIEKLRKRYGVLPPE